MNRVLKGSLTVAMATVVIGFTVSQARADRVNLRSGCVIAPCVPDALTVGAIPLSFADSSFAGQLNAMQHGSFSVTSSNISGAPGLSSIGTKSGKLLQPTIVGAPPVPEPTTMLLFGTSLAGLAAVLRRRLKKRG